MDNWEASSPALVVTWNRASRSVATWKIIGSYLWGKHVHQPTVAHASRVGPSAVNLWNATMSGLVWDAGIWHQFARAKKFVRAKKFLRAKNMNLRTFAEQLFPLCLHRASASLKSQETSGTLNHSIGPRATITESGDQRK